LAIGDVRLQEDEVTEVEVPKVDAEEISTDVPDAREQQTPIVNLHSGSAAPKSGSATPPLPAVASPTPIRGQNPQLIFE
jgi:hypothetical protein